MFLIYSIERATFSDVNFRIKISDVFIEKGTDVQPDVGTSLQQFDTLKIMENYKSLITYFMDLNGSMKGEGPGG